MISSISVIGIDYNKDGKWIAFDRDSGILLVENASICYITAVLKQNSQFQECEVEFSEAANLVFSEETCGRFL